MASQHLEFDMGRQAYNLLIVFRVYVRENRILALEYRNRSAPNSNNDTVDVYRWNFLGQIDIFSYSLFPTQGTLLVNLLHLLTEIRPLIDQPY